MAGKQAMSGLAQRVLGFIQEHHLVSGEMPLVVAVSGGADSVCLLHTLAELQHELGIALHVAHLNHRLRGAEAEADAEYVRELARRLGIPATVASADVKAYQTRHHLTLEEAARDVRYDFLARVAKSIGAERVAVGHTQDDHIETILMHMIRGTGTRGLRGLQPTVNWPRRGHGLTVVRPLLPVTRAETAAYCRAHRLKPRLDTTNLSLSALRNRIRLELLPLLKSYNPGIREALLRTARIAGDELAYLDAQVAGGWDKAASVQKGIIALDKGRFLAMHPALQRHLLRTAIEKLAGELRDIETRHIEEIMAALDKPAGKRLNLPGGLVFAIDYDRYLLATDEAALSPLPPLEAEYPLKVPGETVIPGWRVKASLLNPEQAKEKFVNDLAACMDLDGAGRKLTVRSLKPGDRFQPLGMDQPKTVAEFMIDAKVPRAWRRHVPLVCSSAGVVWIVGWRIDDRVKLTRFTRQVLTLEFEQR